MDVIIVNEKAGNGLSLKYLELIKKILKSRERKYEVYFTREPHDGTRLSRKHSSRNDVDNIISIGGDGTLNEVLNGMIDSNKGLIVVPGGTGNDFYRSISKYCENFKCDVGCVNKEYFLGTLSIGIDAEVADYANLIKQYNSSALAYLKSVKHIMPKFKGIDIDLKSEKYNRKDNLSMLSFCNSQYYGHGIKINPSGSITDGIFDVLVVDKMSTLKMILVFMKLLVGKHEKDKSVYTYKTDKVLVNFDKLTMYSFDGETRYSREIKLEMHKNKVLINKELDDDIKILTKRYF